LIEFSDEMYMLNSKYSDARHDKMLRHCTRMAENVGGLADALRGREAAEDIVRWIHKRYDNASTNQDYRVALRVFGRRVTEGDEPPESIDWVPSTKPSSHNDEPDPNDMLSWDEAEEMAEATRVSRDAALVAVAFDLGARSSEFRDLSVGDIRDTGNGTSVYIDGAKGTGGRKVSLVPSVPYLNKWLADHPNPDSDAPLWTKLDVAEKPSYQMFRKILRQAAERADVTKTVTLTNFRRSRASDLAAKGMSQAHLEDRMGWVRGSDAAARYIALADSDADREFRRLEGADVPEDDEPDPTAPLECPRCERETPRSKDACVWCGQAMSPTAAQKLDEAEDRLFDSVVAAEDEDLVESLRAIRDRLSDPEVRALLAGDDS
jgi:integrase